jgi:hypothetical protein
MEEGSEEFARGDELGTGAKGSEDAGTAGVDPPECGEPAEPEAGDVGAEDAGAAAGSSELDEFAVVGLAVEVAE